MAAPHALSDLAARREIRLTQVSAALAGCVSLLALADLAGTAFAPHTTMSVAARLAACGTLGVLTFVAFSVLVHHINRLGQLQRAPHRDLPESMTQPPPRREEPALTVLVPSYREEPEVVRRTLLSAALQSAGKRHIILLIDNPPSARGSERNALLAARRLPSEIRSLLRQPQQLCAAAAADFCRQQTTDLVDVRQAAQVLAALHHQIAAWLGSLAPSADSTDAADRLFATAVVGEHQRRMLEAALHWTRRADDGRTSLAEIAAAHAEIRTCFDVDLVSFERKRYVNLSHAPSKAMNLNGYLRLMLDGGSFRELPVAGGLALEPCVAPAASVHAPRTPYVLMVDADTLLLPDYARQMLTFLERPENSDFAVAQTPYSAFPGATHPVERIAGATTDLQYFLHQGMTRFGATFWVGANAIVRTSALRELRTTIEERGWQIDTFLRDGTVIEDTETTLEWRRRGWQLHSHPQRLAYSATPPDFGALVVQRLRWANGGLVLLPSLWRALRQGRSMSLRRSFVEAAIRLHYLISLGPMSLALLLLPLCSFADDARAMWLPLLTLTYLGLYLRDLVGCGYAWHDVFRAYALNLLLIPVNLVGLALSVDQLVRGRKPRFGRTPKVHDRTPLPGTFVVAEMALLCGWALFAVHLGLIGRLGHAVLLFGHVGLVAWGITRFIGWGNAWMDFRQDTRWPALRAEPRPRAARRRHYAKQLLHGQTSDSARSP